MKFVTVTIGGITQDVPEADVSLYVRAGYSVVGETPAAPVAPPQEPPADPESDADPVSASKPSEKSDK